MLINLFQKGKGLEYLQEVYRLSDLQVRALRESLYFETEQHDKVDIQWSLFLNDEPDSAIMSIPNVWPRWQIEEDAIERFLKITGIKLDEFDLSDLRFQCIHVSPVIDGGKSIKKYGLRKLTDLLEKESPIKLFLSEYGIEVCPSKREYCINGEKKSVDETALAIKLYSTNSEIEAFIAGDIGTLKDYSCIEDNPEFLRELSPLRDIDLQSEWKKRKNLLVYVVFDISFDECANISRMSQFRALDNYERIIPFLSKEYKYGKEPENIWRNFWFIDVCIENSCPEVRIDRAPMAVKADVALGPERIKIWTAEDLRTCIAD